MSQEDFFMRPLSKFLALQLILITAQPQKAAVSIQFSPVHDGYVQVLPYTGS